MKTQNIRGSAMVALGTGISLLLTPNKEGVDEYKLLECCWSRRTAVGMYTPPRHDFTKSDYRPVTQQKNQSNVRRNKAWHVSIR